MNWCIRVSEMGTLIEDLLHHPQRVFDQTSKYSNYSWAFTVTTFFLLLVLGTVAKKFIKKIIVPPLPDSDDYLANKYIFDIITLWTTLEVQLTISAYTAIAVYPLSEITDAPMKFIFLIIITFKVVRTIGLTVDFLSDQVEIESVQVKNYSVNLTKGIKLLIWAGGLAVALASQSILVDTFASFTLFIDRPFSVGDKILINNNYTGIVSHVGFKTTKLKGVYGEDIIMPNNHLTTAVIQNYKSSEKLAQKIDFDICRGTTATLVHALPGVLEKSISKIPNVECNQVFLKSMDKYSMVFEVRYQLENSEPFAIREALGKVFSCIHEELQELHINAPTVPYPHFKQD